MSEGTHVVEVARRKALETVDDLGSPAPADLTQQDVSPDLPVQQHQLPVHRKGGVRSFVIGRTGCMCAVRHAFSIAEAAGAMSGERSEKKKPASRKGQAGREKAVGSVGLVLVGQQQRGGGAIRFRDDPQLGSVRQSI